MPMEWALWQNSDSDWQDIESLIAGKALPLQPES